MSNNIYYISGSKKNPEGVKKALYEVCTADVNIDKLNYDVDDYLYYVLKGRIDYAWDTSHKILLREIGTELQPIDVDTEEKSKFRLPTKEEFEKLIDKHFVRWSDDRKSLEILNNASRVLTLPAAGGSYLGTTEYNVGVSGIYWSSTIFSGDTNYAYSVYFSRGNKGANYSYRDNRYSVRLVSDEPFEDGILFDGIYWKQENEHGYYSYNEAIEQFNKK